MRSGFGRRAVARAVLRGIVTAAARKSIRRDEPDPSAEYVSASETTEAADDPLRPLVRHPPPSAAPSRPADIRRSAATTARLSEHARRRASAYGANGKRHLARVGAGGRGRRAIAGRRRGSGSRQARRGASGARSGIPRRRTATRIGSGCRGRRRGARPERAMRARPAGPRAKTRHARTISPPPAEHTEAVCGDYGRTATRSRTCVRRAVAWTPESPEMHRAHGCDEIARTLTRQKQAGAGRGGCAKGSRATEQRLIG